MAMSFAGVNPGMCASVFVVVVVVVAGVVLLLADVTPGLCVCCVSFSGYVVATADLVPMMNALGLDLLVDLSNVNATVCSFLWCFMDFLIFYGILWYFMVF
jgi:hypothetical protein